MQHVPDHYKYFKMIEQKSKEALHANAGHHASEAGKHASEAGKQAPAAGRRAPEAGRRASANAYQKTGTNERCMNNLKRLLVTGGGTGGHVYPALSVLEAFDPLPELLWVGKEGGMEEPIVRRAGIPYRSIAAGGLRDMAWSHRLFNSVKLVRGFGQAWHVLRNFRPDVILATGGYVTFPVGLAAWLQRIPIAIYLPDIMPGWAVRGLAPLSTKIAVTTPETTRWFGKKAVVTGYPVRQALTKTKSKAAARQSFKLPPDANVLLVTGGSQGAKSLNEAIGHFLTDYLELTHVIHVHGKSSKEWLTQKRDELPPRLQERYQLYSYLHETMIDALLAADLVVARAGASVLGEFTAAGLPAILVPLPIAGVNQQDNARWLEKQGGALILKNAGLQSHLLPAVQSLFDNPSRLDAMQQAMRAAAHPTAAANIVAMLHSLVKYQ